MHLKVYYKILTAGLTVAALAGCATTQEKNFARGTASESSSAEFICMQLGSSAPRILTVNGDNLIMNSGSQQNGSKVDSSLPGYTAFGNFQPAGGFLNSGDMIYLSQTLLQTGTGTVRLTMQNVGPYYEDTNCHTFTAVDAQKTSCEAVTAQLGMVDFRGVPEVRKTDDANIYRWTLGDYVYDVTTQQTGPICTTQAVTPVSCSAKIAVDVAGRARRAGSSSGVPFVQKNNNGSYTSGIHDPESGEFIYSVQVAAQGSSCRVVSAHRIGK